MNKIFEPSSMEVTNGKERMKSMFYNPIAHNGSHRVTHVSKAYATYFKSAFAINPPQIPMDSMSKEALSTLDKKLEQISTDNILTFDLQSNLEKCLPCDDVVTFSPKEELEKEGKTGVIRQVSNDLNRAYLAPTTRLILHYSHIYAYILYRIIKGLNINDKDGIKANIEPELQTVREYINVQLVSLFLEENNLVISQEQKTQFENAVLHMKFPYTTNEVEQTLTLEYEKIVEAGSLYALVYNFLENTIELPDNLNKADIANKMVRYLLRLNLKIDVQEGDADNLELIHDVGPETKKAFIRRGITKFVQIKDKSDEELMEIWKEAKNNPPNSYDEVRKEAALLANAVNDFNKNRVIG